MQEKYNIRIGAYDDDRDLTYGELMASSKFALVAPGGLPGDRHVPAPDRSCHSPCGRS